MNTTNEQGCKDKQAFDVIVAGGGPGGWNYGCTCRGSNWS